MLTYGYHQLSDNLITLLTDKAIAWQFFGRIKCSILIEKPDCFFHEIGALGVIDKKGE